MREKVQDHSSNKPYITLALSLLLAAKQGEEDMWRAFQRENPVVLDNLTPKKSYNPFEIACWVGDYITGLREEDNTWDS